MRIEPLALHPEVLPLLAGWFEVPWPDYYGAGGRGDAKRDLQAYANLDGLPYGVVAFHEGAACGVAALKADSIASHAHLSPWAAAGLVRADFRGRGIGPQLLLALEDRARGMGFSRIYCATNTAERLLLRLGWRLMERVAHDGEVVGLYEKLLTTQAAA